MAKATSPDSSAQDRPAFVYLLADPRESDPIKRVRYVGVSKEPIERRLRDHLRLRGNNRRSHWVRELAQEGLQPVIELIEQTRIDLGYVREAFWIAELRQRGCLLTNDTAGGPGLTGASEDVRAKIATAGMGREHSPESREKRRRAMIGRVFSEETRQRMSASAKVKAFSPDHRRRLSEANRGERSYCAKLTWDKVRAIRARYEPKYGALTALAREYGVSVTTIREIVLGTHWREEQPDDNSSPGEEGAA